MPVMIKLRLFAVAIALLFAAASQSMAATPDANDASAGAENPEDALLARHLEDGSRMLQSGLPARAISEHFDKVIDAFQVRFKDEKRKIYTGRWSIDKLMYMVEAAASKEEPKRGAIVVSSLWSDAYYLKAYALVEFNRQSEAKSALEAALVMAPRHAQYLSELGNLYLAQRNWPLAFQTFELAEAAAKEFSPPYAKNIELSRAWRGKGYVYIEQDRLDDAEKIYLQCLELDRNDKRAQSQLDYIQHVRSRKKAASPSPV